MSNQVLSIPELIPESLELALLELYGSQIKRLAVDYTAQARVVRKSMNAGIHLPPFLERCANRVECAVDFTSGSGAHIVYGFGAVSNHLFSIVIYEIGGGNRLPKMTRDDLSWYNVTSMLRGVTN